MSEEMKKSCPSAKGQPVALATNESTNEAYHGDNFLSNKRDRALGWLRMLVMESSRHELEEGVWATGFYDGIHIKGIRQLAGEAGLTLTVDGVKYDELRIEYFTFDGVQFYELFRKGE